VCFCHFCRDFLLSLFIRDGMLQQFGNDWMDLPKYCLGHLFTYQEFVDPPGSSSHIFGLAWVARPIGNSGICSGCHDGSVVLMPVFVPEYVILWNSVSSVLLRYCLSARNGIRTVESRV